MLIKRVLRKDILLFSYFIYILSILITLFFFLIKVNYFFIGVFSLLVVYYGTHEAVHGNLSPIYSTKYKRTINEISGILGFSLVGHNFILLRWSHLAHHRYGRSEIEYTIEGNAHLMSKPKGLIFYYLNLFGLSCLYYEIAGYLYPIFGTKLKFMDKKFKKTYYRNLKYLLIQIFVFFVTLVLIIKLGVVKFLIIKLSFMIYWGMSQNVAHYGLPIGKYENSHLAARTYRVNFLIEMLMFGAGTRHLEHHAFPNIPGSSLHSKKISEELHKKYSITPTPIKGFHNYMRDFFLQFYGPFMNKKKVKIRDWKL